MAHRARKRFGQHFLVDEGVLGAISRAIAPQASDTLLEIGPGHGALTDWLIDDVARYVAIEIDRDLVPLLAARYPQMELIKADVLQIDWLEVLDADHRWRLVGNLPYNISSPLMLSLFAIMRLQPSLIVDAFFMLQQEMALRLAAQPGTKAWGRLSVVAQLSCVVEPVLTVEPESFDPPPKVTSMVIRLRPATTPVEEGVMDRVDRVLRLAFAGRRKRLSNALQSLDLDWQHLDLDPGLRADNVTTEQFLRIAHSLTDD